MKSHGFSYAEVILALAIFSIALAALLPGLTQAQRNSAYARSHYEALLTANEGVRLLEGALARGEAPDPGLIEQRTNTAFTCGYYVFDLSSAEIIASFVPDDTAQPPSDPAMRMTSVGCAPGGTGILVCAYDAEGRMAARAWGMVP